MQTTIESTENIGYAEYIPPVLEIKPRPYQVEAKELTADKVREGKRVIMLILSGGAGKTVISAMYFKGVEQKGKQGLFIAHRRELIKGAQTKFKSYGMVCGILMGTEREDRFRPIQIASIQTLSRRELPPASFVIIDEGHRAHAPQYRAIIDYYKEQGAVIVLLTGTPFMPVNIKDIADDYINNIKSSELIAQGFILPAKVYGVSNSVSTKKMHSKRGEFLDNELMLAFDKDNVYINLISNYERLAKNKKTICFCCSTEHSRKSSEAFNTAGYPSRHIDANTPQKERDETIYLYMTGKVIVLCNYGILAEGFDVPDTEVIIMNTATKSWTKWLQACWRGARISPDKTHYIVIDMADNERRFGYPDIDIEVDMQAHDHKNKGVNVAPSKMCKNCHLVIPVSSKCCMECGYEFPVSKHKIEEQEFVELDRNNKTRKWNRFTKKDWNKIALDDLEEFAKFKGFKDLWVKMEKERRLRGEKFIKIEGFDGNQKDYYSICEALKKKYYSNKPIDASMFVFVKETEIELVFRYIKAEEV